MPRFFHHRCFQDIDETTATAPAPTLGASQHIGLDTHSQLPPDRPEMPAATCGLPFGPGRWGDQTLPINKFPKNIFIKMSIQFRIIKTEQIFPLRHFFGITTKKMTLPTTPPPPKNPAAGS